MIILGVTELRRATNKLVEISQELPSNLDCTRKGGVLTVGLDGFSQRCILNIGSYPADKIATYTNLSQEKAHRAYADWLRSGIIVSSWQTRSPEESKWGGAVLFPPTEQLPNIISFSGLAELTDEAISLVLGRYLGLAQKNYADNVAVISGNNVYKELFKKFNAH